MAKASITRSHFFTCAHLAFEWRSCWESLLWAGERQLRPARFPDDSEDSLPPRCCLSSPFPVSPIWACVCCRPGLLQRALWLFASLTWGDVCLCTSLGEDEAKDRSFCRCIITKKTKQNRKTKEKKRHKYTEIRIFFSLGWLWWCTCQKKGQISKRKELGVFLIWLIDSPLWCSACNTWHAKP